MVSIHGPLGYGPSTLPLRHSAPYPWLQHLYGNDTAKQTMKTCSFVSSVSIIRDHIKRLFNWCTSNFNLTYQQGQGSLGTSIVCPQDRLCPLYTLLQTLDINLVTNFKCPPFTVTSIWVELSSPSYFEIAVPNDPRRSSPPDAKVEFAARVYDRR